jgi:DNA-binding NarL/FixJ family response regulator
VLVARIRAGAAANVTQKVTKAQRAHWKMLCTLPVRTVAARAPEYDRKGKPGARPPAHTRELHERILILQAKGYRPSQIARELGISLPTVGKHLSGKIRPR